jgi:DNA-binding XRE family transcriptional regulator
MKTYGKWSDLKAKMSPESRAEIERRKERMLSEMPLEHLRAARQLTQTSLATVLGVNQSAVSKLEKRTDMYLSTLRSYIEAMGGQLDIQAVFPEGSIRIDVFGGKASAPTDSQIELEREAHPETFATLG